MAFRRTSFSALKSQKKEYFESIYKFSKKVPNFKEGSDVYVLPLGLEQGYCVTPCHRILPHKVDGQTIGYGGSSFAVYVKCTGVDEEGNNVPLLDSHGHLIVKHDLFNHDGLTGDGIAEAFAEFAKKEKLSFFADAPLMK